ncbi:MAG TPA: SGNH/GDSL hydrolase family protein [Acidimicrobiales bacterium]
MSAGPAIIASASKPAIPMYYVSLGDSYGAGYQGGAGTPGGYATDVVGDVAPTHRLMLRNYACGGATTTSMLSTVGCAFAATTNAVAYPTTTQLAAAIGFIKAHPGRIGLITITIGGNNILESAPNVPAMQADIVSISAQLRAAAGGSVPIIGLTYPDVELAEWLSGGSGITNAQTSVTDFKLVVNPALVAGYAPSKITFVDITTVTGAYAPFTRLVDYSTYGEIPYAVAQVCTLTWMCSQNNVHPTDAGYALIAKQIVKVYLKLIF